MNNVVKNFKKGKKFKYNSPPGIRKMQTAAGGPIYASPLDIENAANLIGSGFLKGLGYLGQVFSKVASSPNWSGSPAANNYARTIKLARRLKIESDIREELFGRGSTWLSPLHYAASLATGNWLDAEKGAEVISKLPPYLLALGRAAEIYLGPKGVKGATKVIKTTPKAVVNTAAKAGVKPAKAAVVAREINKGVNENTPKYNNRIYSIRFDDHLYNYSSNPLLELVNTIKTSPTNSYFMRAPSKIDITKLHNGRFRHEVVGNNILPSGEVNGKFVSYGEPWKEFGFSEGNALYEFPVGSKRGPNMMATDWKGRSRNYSVNEAYDYMKLEKLLREDLRLLNEQMGELFYKNYAAIRNNLIETKYPLLKLHIDTSIYGGNQTVIPDLKWNFNNFLNSPFYKYTLDPISNQVQKELVISGVPNKSVEPSTSLKFFEMNNAIEQFKKGGQIRKMQTASGGPIIDGGIPFSITVKGKDRRPAWKRMYLNPNLGDTSEYYNGNILEGAIGLIPGIGDAIDAVKAADAVNNKNYTTAGFLGAGLLLPNIVEKPLKFAKGLYKGYKANKIMKTARKAFNESGEKLEVDAFKSGSKPMYVTPAKGPGSDHINVISDELKDSKYLDLERPFGKDETLTLRYYINEDKLKQTIETYKDFYKNRLGLNTNNADEIYNYIISNPKVLDLNANPGTPGLLDVIGISLGYGPKDAILFNMGYNGLYVGNKVPKEAIESMKVWDYDKTLPGIYNILKKNIERGTLGVKSTNTNGGHVGFGYVKNRLGGKMNILEFLKNGSGIHIKEKNKGKFTSYCGGKVTDECILKGKNSSNPAIRKRATFAANARKWKHKEGGIIKAADGTSFKLKISNFGSELGSTLLNTGISIAGGFIQNNAINKLMKANNKNKEVAEQKAFFDKYLLLKALKRKNGPTVDDNGNIINHSSVVSDNEAWNEALKTTDTSEILDTYNRVNAELGNQKYMNLLDTIWNSIGEISSAVLNNIGKKKNTNSTSSTSSSNNTFGNYVGTLLKNYGTFNSDGSMNLGGGLGTFSITGGYKPQQYQFKMETPKLKLPFT